MTRPSDLDTILLAAAAQRDSGSLLPAPPSLADAGGRLTKAVTTLIKRGLVVERETSDAAAIHRCDGDCGYGVFITPAGQEAIGLLPVDAAIDTADAGADIASAAPTDSTDALASMPPAAAPARITKSASVLALLERVEGATPAELIALTGWLPHTTRAALTGLRKKGHAIERSKRGDETCYCVVAAIA